jgi:hypothetical protein
MKIRLVSGPEDYESWETLRIFQLDREVSNLLICDSKG